MVTLCWAVKGGSGTTVVAAALALSTPRPSLLVDLDGELPTVLGVPESDRPGVADWLASSAPAAQLAELMIETGDRTWLLPWRAAGTPARPIDSCGDRWAELGTWMSEWSTQRGCRVVVDGGTRQPPATLHDRVERSLLVTRPCYLAIVRAERCPIRPSGIILVDEPGRGLDRRAVEKSVGAPVEATLSLDPAVARAVDAGLLTCRLPRTMTRGLRSAAA